MTRLHGGARTGIIASMKRKKRKYVHKYEGSRLRRVDYLLFGIMAFAATMLVIVLVNYARDRNSYERARALAVSAPVITPSATLVPVSASTPAPTAVPLPTPPVTVDFDAIRAEGRNVRGWLFCENTLVNYPVTYYTNNEYYLTHDYKGDRSNAGALFFDTRVSRELLGDNLIIYGHHMKDRSMFGSLLQYQKQDYYDAHPTMYLLTLNGNYRVDLFAARFADSAIKNYPIWFTDAQQKKAFAMTAMNNSDFTPADKAFREDARILTLVTCAYSNYIEDAKYAVYGWLVPIG